MIYWHQCIHNSQVPTQPKFFWSFSNLYSNLLWSFWVVSWRKIKIWIRGKKVQFITESCVFKAETPTNLPFQGINWTFFPRIQILIFLGEATQNDHIRLLYKFEMDKKILVVLGVVDMRQLLLMLLKIVSKNHKP